MSVVPIRGAHSAPKSEQSRMETLILTPEMVHEWRIPPFQRPLRINDKVRDVQEQIKKEEVIQGVITLGKVKGDPNLYVVDGQHRIEAFKLSGTNEVLADVRVVMFDKMSEMADEFVRLNTALVKMRPDDILRGLESSVPVLALIRGQCAFVGYDNIRRNEKAPMVSMSALLRCWHAGRSDNCATGGQSAAMSAQNIDPQAASDLVAFLNTAVTAWGRDPEHYRLWSNLNISICLWLWNRLVIDRDRSGNRRYALLSSAEFKQCLMQLAADENYSSWLIGRNLSERDRSPCYARVKGIFNRRLTSMWPNRKFSLPAPPWAANVKV